MSTVARKLSNREECTFYHLVMRGEGGNVVLTFNLVRRRDCAGQFG